MRLTFTRHTDDSIGVAVHFEQLQDFLDIGILFLLGYVMRLTKFGRELQGFPDGRGLKVEILLLDVASLALEGDIAGSTIDKDFTSDDTHCNTSGQNVEQSGLAGARDTLMISFLSLQRNRESQHTMRAVKVPGFTHPSTWSRIRLSSFLILMSYTTSFQVKTAVCF